MWDGQGWKKWRLVVKLDPDKKPPEEVFEIIRDPNIDAVIIGGTQGITRENTEMLVRSVRHSGFGGPLAQEISAEDVVVPGVDAHLIPVVLNAGTKKWLLDAHLSAIKKYGEFIRWDRVLTEGYLVCNTDSAVGRLTGAVGITVEDAVAYTVLAEEIYHLPLLYIEYSGVFGDTELVGAVSRVRKNIHLVYGGGIKTPGQLWKVASLVDTVVIGNILYEDPRQARVVIESFTAGRMGNYLATVPGGMGNYE